VRSFAQEAIIIARLAHPNIVSVYDFGHTDGPNAIYYLSMQFVNGETVKDILAKRKLTLDETIAIIRQVAAALDVAHREEVIHRDIKPGNIIVCPDGKALVMDFGVASGYYAGGSGSVFLAAGSPAYMAPEQCKGRNASPRSDQYSLGVTVYEMITGRLPFPDNDPTVVMRKHISEPPPPLRMGRMDITSRLEAAVMRALSKLPEMRFLTVGAFAEELDAARREAPALDPLARSVPTPPVPSGTVPGIARGPVSLITGEAPPSTRPADPLSGYVFTTRSSAAGKLAGPMRTLLLVAVLLSALAAAGYFAYQKLSAPAAVEDVKLPPKKPKAR
jgi:serine/threonine-protein kinase